MAGQAVSRADLDYKLTQTLVATKAVIADIETVNAYLERNPLQDGVDPLVEFGYNEDEIYLIRSTFQQLAGMKSAVSPVLDNARALTGLL